ncbi:hypothetical protein PspLS_00700 [Pyricularia sp. CBS 133598]|nr:hypothetical protein PspLS_00700 [Pyricularia sp. CBS 133598]
MTKQDETVTMKAHEAAVQVIAKQVQGFRSRNGNFRIFHGSTNSTRPAHGNKTIDISALNNFVKVDTASKTALVEPNVPMDKLVASTLKHGLVPPVVMEFPGITVGGGYSGSAGESSSFRYGYFDQSVNWVEMILGTGEVVQASATENADLFKGVAGAMGTLEITNLVELQLLPAKRLVKTTYHIMAQNRRLEGRLGELGGRKVLYSHAYYTEGEFCSLYDRKWYEGLRERYGTMSGGHRPRQSGWWARFWSMWPVAGLVGIRSAIRSSDYLHHRKPIWRHSLGGPIKNMG